MRAYLTAAALLVVTSCADAPIAASLPAPHAVSIGDTVLARQIRADPILSDVLGRARVLVGGGLNAGALYPETWIRDLATFERLRLLSGQPPDAVRHSLLTFLAFQQPSGAVPDGYIRADQNVQAGRSLSSPLEPGLVAFTNSVDSDQETSYVQAVSTYIEITGDVGLLDAHVAGATVRARTDAALRHVFRDRSSGGLIWSGVTVAWGDVQAGTDHPTQFGPGSRRAISVYANAMLVLALRGYVRLPGVDVAYWDGQLAALTARVQAALWDDGAGMYRAHLYLDGSPWPSGFDESAVSDHGGTAVAARAGLLTPDQVRRALRRMDSDVAAAHARSIGLNVWPYYPSEAFGGGDLMAPGSYQNGGDWDWFGARWVQALLASGDPADAYRELRPMVARVHSAGDFYEWWDIAGRPRSSAGYRGAAGEMGLAILELEGWAEGVAKPV